MIIDGNWLVVLGQKLSIFGGTMKGALNMGNNILNGLAEPTDNDHAATKFYADEIGRKAASDTLSSAKKYADSLTTFSTITLAADKWTGEKAPFSQAVSCDSVTTKNAVMVSPVEESRRVYIDCEVHCSSQSEKTLTFVCEDKPEVALTVSIMTHEV